MTARPGVERSHAAEPIAIIGMQGRFPGAGDLHQYWENLAAGVESITELSREDMRSAGVPDHITRLPGYVNASPLLDDVDRFDAAFFGFSPRDAALTDPQHRLFLETAWAALEDAGYDPKTYAGPIGVFGGCELSTYLYQLYQNIEALGYIDGMQLMVTNDKDHLCTQVSYRLNLRGPSVAVQTTCSTSLVAVGLACESLQAGRCDMALAGGVTVRVPQRGGYLYVQGSILSPDGHCRPFDARAQGTIVGSGVGIVVLKRLEQALADGDGVRAVILGVGLNNDGSDKVGYTAPGFRGQAEALAATYEMAGVSPDSIGFVEAHGTGTILGDPIEISALTEVFSAHTNRRGYCAVGSVKSNFGHLSCAAGVAGLIKAVLTMERGAIPPTVHYEEPNPAIDFVSSPFYVTTTLHPWERNGGPRRAAVSSFGVGGTNAHALLEEAPGQAAPTQRRSQQLLVLSARSESALDEATANLAAHLERQPEQDLADVAFTLHVGRRPFQYRRSLVVGSDDRSGAVAAVHAARAREPTATGQPPGVVFMFPGQGAQYPGMAAGLYEAEPVVRATIDSCAALLEPELGLDLRGVLFPPSRNDHAAAVLRDTALAQPALFVVEYALAELWRSWGVEPAAVLGHSVGEYVAAVLAGVMTPEDALRLLARRGALISALPPGSMLAVMTAAETFDGFLDADVSLAAVNAPGLCVLSGPDPAIERVEAALQASSVPTRRLHTSHAFHSSMMDPILGEFEALVAQVSLAAPRVPYVATLTGAWADGEVTAPSYWSRQLRSTVRFGDSLCAVGRPGSPAGDDAVLLEVGPGRTLMTFAAQAGGNGSAPPQALACLPGGGEQRSDGEVILGALGRLWELGVAVDWAGFHRTERRRRVSLPTYPFERESYWIGPIAAPDPAATQQRDPADWFYLPAWQDAPLDPGAHGPLAGARVLVFDEGAGLGASVAQALTEAGGSPIVVRRGAGDGHAAGADHVLDPGDADAFARLAAVVCGTDDRLAGVVHCWGAEPSGASELHEAALVTFLGPLRLAHALGSHNTVRPLPVLLAARGTARLGDGDELDPARSFGLGAAKVVPQEHPGLRVAHVDVDGDAAVPGMLVAELAAGAAEPEVALRGGRRYTRSYEPLPIPSAAAPADLPADPVVFITGGLGYMGLFLGEALFDRLGARLVLVTRKGVPPPDTWEAVIDSPNTQPDLRAALSRLAALRARRDDVLVVAADVDDAGDVAAAVDAAMARYGTIDLVVHGAADVSIEAFASVSETTADVVTRQISPKVRGVQHLVEALRDRAPTRWVLQSSISTALGGLGLAAYAGANAVLDTIAQHAPGDTGDWVSIGWDAWDNAAEAQMTAVPTAISPAEGQEAFLRLLGAPVGRHVIVAAADLESRLEAWVRRSKTADSSEKRHPRPNLATPFVEPRTDVERDLADIWASQLGLEAVGVHDRFFDLGGHSLLAVQVASEIRDRFQIEMPVLELFKAPTVAELAPLIEQGRGSAGGSPPPLTPSAADPGVMASAAAIEGDDPGSGAKARYREFYDDVTRRLERTGMGDVSFFLNYGYVSLGEGDEAALTAGEGDLNASSIRLACELIGSMGLDGWSVLDVGCGRGGTVALLADRFGADAVGVDLSPEAVEFCRRTHRASGVRFEVGDAENLPFDPQTFDAVVNIESSHTYPHIRAFLAEVKRVLRDGGWFLHTDLLAVERWMEVRALLGQLGLVTEQDREITANVLASCDAVAANRTKAFGDRSAAIDNFLAVPGSPVYEQMRSGAWQYRIMRSRLARARQPADADRPPELPSVNKKGT